MAVKMKQKKLPCALDIFFQSLVLQLGQDQRPTSYKDRPPGLFVSE